MKLLLLPTMMLLLIGGEAFAQNCPSGIPSAGNPQCVPPPNVPGSPLYRPNPGQNQSIPRAPQARWMSQWGAIAIDAPMSKMGVAEGKTNRKDAERAALAACRAKGGEAGECKKNLVVFGNSCGVVAWGESYVSLRSEGTRELAASGAMKECSQHSADCQVYYASCSYPLLIQ